MFDYFWLSVPVQLIAWKDSSPNDLLCVEWDVKPYTLTHSQSLMQNYRRAGTSSVGDSTTNYISFDAAVKYGPKFHRLDYWHSHKS